MGPPRQTRECETPVRTGHDGWLISFAHQRNRPPRLGGGLKIRKIVTQLNVGAITAAFAAKRVVRARGAPRHSVQGSARTSPPVSRKLNCWTFGKC